MHRYLAALALVFLFVMVLTRVFMLRRAGTKAMHFGRIDKKDYLIPPFVLFYSYTVFAAAFDLPIASHHVFFRAEPVSWIGVAFCFVGLALLLLSLVSFGKSFRVGIDVEQPDKLVTTGLFAHTRNPIYVAFVLVLLGQFLVFPDWILLVYLVASGWLIHRQVLREEEFMRKRYGEEYEEYCRRVRRY